MKSAIFGGVFAAASVLAASAAFAVYAPQDAATLYNQRCNSCHDGSEERAPDRTALMQRTPESVIDALTNGAMRPMAAGLSADQVRQIATFVTGKPLASAAPAAPAQPQAGRGGAGAGRGGQQAAAAPVAQPADNMCATHPAIRAAATDWNGFGKDIQGSRRQTATTINANNVERLRVKWSFAVAGGRYGQPTVIGDHLFLATGAGQTYALDAKTGCVHWRANLGGSSRTSPYVVNLPGASPSGWVVYVGDRNRDVYALDGMTGKTLWKTNVETHPRSVLTGSPVVYKDTLYVPTSSGEETIASQADYGCCTFIGSVAALDAKTGKLKWKTPMLEGNKPTRKNSAGTQMYGPAGAAIWSQPTIDPKRGALYIATGDSYTETVANRSDSIVALDLTTGKIKWANQVTEHDNFLVGCNPQRPAVNCPLGTLGPDHDFGASPIIHTLADGKQILLAGQKSSQVYGIDPDTGKKLWDIKLGTGGALGGVEWGMAADNKRLYVSNSDSGRPAPANPSVSAIDPATGKIIWQVKAPRVPCNLSRCSVAQSAPPTVIPGVVFAGGMDSWMRAYAADTGRGLWLYDAAARTYDTTNGVKGAQAGSFDATGPVVSGGSMFVIAGYTGATGGISYPLNVLLAFTVDGK